MRIRSAPRPLLWVSLVAVPLIGAGFAFRSHLTIGFDIPDNYGRPIRREGVPSLSLLRLAGF